MQKVVPIPLSSLFNLNADYHHYSTCQRDNLHIHSLKYSYLICFQGPQIWNSIPLSLGTSLTLSSYKSELQDYYLCLLISQPSFPSYYVVFFLAKYVHNNIIVNYIVIIFLFFIMLL